MGKPYSNDLRERVVAAIEAGHTRVEVAELYNMALSTVGGFIKRKRETGSVRPDKFGGYKTFALEDHTARVKELVAEQPDTFFAQADIHTRLSLPGLTGRASKTDRAYWIAQSSGSMTARCINLSKNRSNTSFPRFE